MFKQPKNITRANILMSSQNHLFSFLNKKRFLFTETTIGVGAGILVKGKKHSENLFKHWYFK